MSGSRDRDTRHLHPVVVPILNEHRMLAAQDSLCGPTTVIETHRTQALQDADYSRGRDRAGNVIDPSEVVTKSRGGNSWHNLYRWVFACPDCHHSRSSHMSPPGGGDILICDADGPNLGEGCSCRVDCLRLERSGFWQQWPASLAYHVALHCIAGCHPSGTLLGFGAHARLVPADLLRIKQLGKLAASLSLRCGIDWDQDGIPLERGENDLYHYEYQAGGTLAQVQAVLSIRGGDLVWPKSTPASGGLSA